MHEPRANGRDRSTRSSHGRAAHRGLRRRWRAPPPPPRRRAKRERERHDRRREGQAERLHRAADAARHETPADLVARNEPGGGTEHERSEPDTHGRGTRRGFSPRNPERQTEPDTADTDERERHESRGSTPFEEHPWPHAREKRQRESRHDPDGGDGSDLAYEGRNRTYGLEVVAEPGEEILGRSLFCHGLSFARRRARSSRDPRWARTFKAFGVTPARSAAAATGSCSM